MASTADVPAARAPLRVSTLELFFDLVFVFTITQVALIVEHSPSWSAVAQALLELFVIYWMYGGFAWLTNNLGATAGTRLRVVMLLGMASFLVVSLGVPRAFDADGVAFGYAYLALNVIHLIGYLSGGVHSLAVGIRGVGVRNLTASGLVIAAGYADGAWWHWTLWIAAAAIQWLPQLFSDAPSGFVINAAHFGERHGLMIIIVLGESLVSVAVAAEALKLSLGLALGVLGGLAASAALWWCYFVGDDEAAAAALDKRNREGRTRALLVFDLPHVLMMAGIVGVAAGSRLSLPQLTESTSLPAAALLSGGAGLYLLALAFFRAVLPYANPVLRLGAGVVMPALIPIGTQLGAAQQLAAIAVMIGVMLSLERVAAASGDGRGDGRGDVDTEAAGPPAQPTPLRQDQRDPAV